MKTPVHGPGLGLRRAILTPLLEQQPQDIKFLEIAPENWMRLGGALGRKFRELAEIYPITCHGLSLSIGGPDPLDLAFVKELKQFLDTHNVCYYTEHLSYCSDDGQLYDLMPIPFTAEAVKHTVARIKQVQDILEQRIAIENVSYYAAPHQEMAEIDFLNAVLSEADCDLLLDVNNIYVNSINHNYNPQDYLLALPAERVKYTHVAGHFDEAEDLRVDTHGADVIDPVWELLQQAYAHVGVVPTLLERDFNIPTIPELLIEIQQIAKYQQQAAQAHTLASA